MKSIILFLFLLPSLVVGQPSELHLNTLYHSLDRYSIAELFAFYHLYPETPQGKNALVDAWKLMNLHRPKESQLDENLALPDMDLQSIISFVNKQSFEPSVVLSDDQLKTIEKVSDHLSNRKLKGFSVWTKDDVIGLPVEEIDLARSILIYQFENAEDPMLQIRQYEASLDLMALQIMARLPPHASDEDKIHAINTFIFHEKRFRFPPHSIWAKDVDVYTFLPSVLDSRLGVCLGVSILYLSIAQRMDLPLEIITPPGHIYVRYQTPGKTINIETTARGVSPPSKVYLGLNTRSLQQRNIKEVIGLAFINQAAVAWQKEDHQATVDLYEKALPYLQDDPLLKMFLGYNYLFVGKAKEGKALLEEIRDLTFDHAVSKETTPEDFLEGRTDAKGIQTIFLHVDETRASILEKQEKLKKVLEKYPKFRDGLMHLAITQLQLAQAGDALKTLLRYHELEPNNPTVEYYLSIVLLERLKCQKAWEHLKNAETLTSQRDHHPEALKGLRHHLRTLYPDPEDTVSKTRL